ncbi:MAG: hypothetical protein CMK54_06485 [Proteobacteria bacterium]|nr:hypothetical protein [Pseudomonadota bacterium]
MSDSQELPKKGVKIYSPDEGWIERQVDENTKQPKLPITSIESTNESTDQSTHNVVINEENSTNEKKEGEVLAVGDALEQLFETLNKSTSGLSDPENSPTWKDVAELSRQLEEKLDLRREVLEKLSLLDEDLQETRKTLLKTLKTLGKTENEKLSAATVRASVSAMAIDVLAKKLT